MILRLGATRIPAVRLCRVSRMRMLARLAGVEQDQRRRRSRGKEGMMLSIVRRGLRKVVGLVDGHKGPGAIEF